jgi:hypothetical protein
MLAVGQARANAQGDQGRPRTPRAAFREYGWHASERALTRALSSRIYTLDG